MKSQGLTDCALLGENQAFFAKRLTTTQSVPGCCAANDAFSEFYVGVGRRKPEPGTRWVIGQKRV